MSRTRTSLGQLIPASGYRSRKYFHRELSQLFGHCWLYSGMADDIPKPGDFLCVGHGNFPLVVLRDLDGKLRAFHNICRHRGMQILDGTGNTLRGITCRYHNWAYKLDGRLKTIPRRNDLFPDVDKSSLGLLPASVEEFRGLIFAHPDPSPGEDFAAFRAGLDEKIGPHHPDKMVEISRKRYVFDANWKFVVENYLDTYHLLYLHDKTVPMFDHTNFQWETTGRHVLLHEPVRDKYRDWLHLTYGLTVDDLVPGVDPDVFGGSFHMLFPNTGWSAMAHSWNTFHVTPLDVDKSLVEVRIRVMPGAVDRVKDPRGDSDQLGNTGDRPITIQDCGQHPAESGISMLEDMWVCQQMQRGVASPHYRVNALANRFEDMLTFHQENILEYVQYDSD